MKYSFAALFVLATSLSLVCKASADKKKGKNWKPDKLKARIGPRCPVLETLGVINLDFNPAFLSAEEVGYEQCLFVTSFFNADVSQPGPPQFFSNDLVASICDLEDLEEDKTYNDAEATIVTDLAGGAPKTVWPNEAIKAPEGAFPFQALVIAQGFHPAASPGRLTAIDLDDPNKTEYIIQQSTQSGPFMGNPFDPENRPWYYHDAQFYDMNNDGFLDIISVRSGFRVGAGGFHPPFGQLVWFENPGPVNLDPNVEWRETVLFGDPSNQFQGPDIFVKMHDFDGDGVPEFVATHFFTDPGPPETSADRGKITVYGAPPGGDWSHVNALDPTSPQARVKNISTE